MFEGSDSVISVSRQLARLTGADYNIYHKHYYVMGTQFKMAFS
jgi:hypothetical protein